MIIHGRMANLEFRPIILDDIRRAQKNDEYLTKARNFDKETEKGEFMIALDGTVRFKDIYVPEI